MKNTSSEKAVGTIASTAPTLTWALLREVLFGVVPVIGFNPQRIVFPIGLKFVLAAFTRHYLTLLVV